LFFQDNARVYAVNLNSGLPLTGWQKSYPGEPRGAFTVDGSPASTPAGVLLPVSVTDDSVVALMSNIDKNAAQFGRLGHPPQLVVLDRATGKPRWTMRASGLKIANDDARLREGQLYGVPSVVGDTIYTLVRASRGGQFREVHVVALSLADGSVKWNSYLASTATNVEFGEFNGEIAPTGSVEQMAFSDGRLYVLSNIGALACFDAADGKTAWLNIYPRLDALTRVERRYMGDRPIPDKPFISNPPIVTDGKVFVMPSDSPSVLVYDAVTGEQLGTVPRTINERDDEKFDAVETLLRVVDNKLILGMRSGFLSVPWQKYDSSKTLVANGGRFRKTSIRGTSAEVDPVQGRPFVTDEYVFVPRVDQLQRLSIREMAIQGLYPESGNWDEATEGPGNVLATPDYLVIAGHNKIVVYADAAMAAAKLDEQIERDPTAVEPKLRYAELMFVAGRPKDAIGWLDKAIATLGGEKNLPHGTARDRLFDVASNYAVKIPGEGAAASALTRELFARARIAADTPQQQVRYRQAHAAMLRKAADGAGEMALHREILANAEWRRQPVSGKGGTVTAASDAEVAIGELAKIDASAFARFAADAESAFAALGTGAAPGDAAALIELSDTFPATPAAVRATGAAAAIYEDAREYRAAGQTLRRLLKYVGANDRAAALESLARVYLRMPAQLDAAIARVDQLQQLAPAGRHSKPMTLADGRAVAGATYAELATELRKHRTSVVDAALPTFGLLPSTGGGAAKKPELMAPEKLVGVAGIIAQAGRTRPDRVVIWQDDNKINQVAAGGVAPLHPPVALPGVPRSAAYAGDTLIAVGSDSVSAISPAGALLWQVPVRGLPDAEVSRTEVATDTPALRDPAGEEGLEAGDPGNGIRIQRGRLGGVGGRIRLNGNMAGIGEAAVAIDTGEETIAYLSVLSDRVVFATGRGRVAAIDLASGRVVWQLRPAEAGLRKMAASEDFVVVATGEEAGNTDVTVLDTITGQALRRTSYEAARNQRFVNLALSPGGMLVTMLTNALVGRDLYDPAASGWDRQATANFNEPVFAGAAGERQLVLSDDRVLAVATINGQQHVRAYDLATGKPLMAQGGKPGTAVEAAFTAAPAAPGNESPLSITAVGPAFYVYTPTALASYHLDKKDWRWAAKVGATIRGTFRDLLLSKDYAVMVNGEAAANINTEKLPAVQLNVFSRALSASGNESGLLERHPSIRDPAGILVGQWQLAEGAFYYVAGNKTLTMLKPNR
ncbi:MAG TPA: PQQ-binding-like beta-propeller repeat protein, partial [Tepidisphaeraceae bacterium]